MPARPPREAYPVSSLLIAGSSSFTMQSIVRGNACHDNRKLCGTRGPLTPMCVCVLASPPLSSPLSLSLLSCLSSPLSSLVLGLAHVFAYCVLLLIPSRPGPGAFGLLAVRARRVVGCSRLLVGCARLSRWVGCTRLLRVGCTRPSRLVGCRVRVLPC